MAVGMKKERKICFRPNRVEKSFSFSALCFGFSVEICEICGYVNVCACMLYVSLLCFHRFQLNLNKFFLIDHYLVIWLPRVLFQLPPLSPLLCTNGQRFSYLFFLSSLCERTKTIISERSFKERNKTTNELQTSENKTSASNRLTRWMIHFLFRKRGENENK